MLTSRHERPDPSSSSAPASSAPRPPAPCSAKGHAVTLIDSAEPGRATSYGNAGFIAIDHVLPLARPSTLKRVPQMLMDRNGPLTVHPPSLPALLPWMARFALAAYSQDGGPEGHRFLRRR